MTRFMPLNIIAIVALWLFSTVAQQSDNRPDLTIDAATRSKVIESIAKRLNDSYVFPDVAKKMEAALHERRSNGEYDSITSAKAFATRLTEDLQAVSKDKHLRVGYSHEALPPGSGRRREPTAEERKEELEANLWMNHAFTKVERLRGNIGYIDFWAFFNSETGGDTVAAAMNFVAGTDALIFDLRSNGGGSPEMVALICSYLFGPEPVHLNDLYWREGDKTQEFWTRKEVPGKRYLKDVYVLTSKRTFSGAEEFAYNLKNLKRATIVGETTGGGAHPGGGFRVHEHFRIFVPTGRAINPITKTNWEGTGVKPDVETPADQALTVARLMALKKSLPTLKDPGFIEGVRDEIEKLEKELSAKASK